MRNSYRCGCRGDTGYLCRKQGTISAEQRREGWLGFGLGSVIARVHVEGVQVTSQDKAQKHEQMTFSRCSSTLTHLFRTVLMSDANIQPVLLCYDRKGEVEQEPLKTKQSRNPKPPTFTQTAQQHHHDQSCSGSFFTSSACSMNIKISLHEPARV